MIRFWAMLVCAYALICSTNYFFANLSFGWLTVVATASVFCATVIYSFRRQSYFAVGFSICGFLWLSSWLGLPIEPPPMNDQSYLAIRHLRLAVIDWMTIGKPTLLNPTGLDVHDIYATSIVTQHWLPEKQNILRLFVCLTSLLSGTVGGACVHYTIARRKLG